MTRKLAVRRCGAARWVLAVTAVAVLGAACGGKTAAADIAPEVREACDGANEQLLALVDVEPSESGLDDAEDYIFTILNNLPDVDTDAGRPRTVIGDHVQAARRGLMKAMPGYDFKIEPIDVPQVKEEVQSAFRSINEGAAQFGVDDCVAPEVLDGALMPQIEAAGEASIVNSPAAPSGDFEVDMAGACERFRLAETEMLIENATDPNAEFLIFSRATRLVGTLESDIGRFDIPADRQSAHDTFVESVQEYRQGIGAIERARLVSQDALDEAVAVFRGVSADFEAALDALHSGC